ncbi:hypothetical protein [Pontiella desulfatans]|nr:hypothetical protein [Pontiella desulfatans]
MEELTNTLATYIFENRGNGVNADGSVIVGYADLPVAGQQEAYRWSVADGMEGLGTHLGGEPTSTAYDVNSGGDVIVGLYYPSESISEAFRWTLEGGAQGLGFLTGTAESVATAVSANGDIVVGYAYPDYKNGLSEREAFRWTEATGCVGLGRLSGDDRSEAKGISADGSTIVGYSQNSSGRHEAFRWTASEGLIGLGDFAGGSEISIAEDASADGSVIVGYSNSDEGPEAFIWDESSGLMNLQDVLVHEHGLDLTGWSLTYGLAVSDNGKVIVGFGTNPDGDWEGWIAWLEIDDDEDGIKDDWEIEHFGSITNCVPTDDSDGDRYTNYEEYINDTQPHQFDIGSAMLWTAVEVGWKSVAGTNYQIQSTTDLSDSNGWENVGDAIIGNGSINTMIFSTRTNEAQKYFRIILAP